MLKSSTDRSKSSVLDVFNDVLDLLVEVPGNRRKTRLVVLPKNGDPLLVKNYSQIAILPIMYKLFARMLRDRLRPDMISEQSPDQAAYRGDIPPWTTCSLLLC